MSLLFFRRRDGGIRRGRPEVTEAKNYPVNGFSVPGLASALPQCRWESHRLRQIKSTIQVLFIWLWYKEILRA